MSENSFGSSRYFVTLIDHCWHYTHFLIIKRKCEVFGKFKELVNLITNQIYDVSSESAKRVLD